ncbi:MAG: DinB family protein [Nitrospinae bacterium]|nr:DinB family protein [Nitrospinota bacterium]
MDAIQFFLLHHERLYADHERLYAQIEERFAGLSDDQMRFRPHPHANSIAWLLWHMACGEDMLNRLVANRALILDEAGWMQRLDLPRHDVGTAMTDEDVSEFSARVDIAALRAYHAAVGRRTQEIARSLRPEDLDVVPERSQIRQLCQEIFGPNIAGVAEQYYAGNTKGWFLGHLALTHPFEHLAQAVLVRKLLGLGSGRP